MRTRRHAGALAPLLWAAMALGATAQPAAPAAPPGAGGDHLVRLTNTGKGAISAVYVAPAGSTDFSDDLLGNQVAGAGRTVSLKIKDPGGTCVFDVQFLLADGSLVTRKGVNVCQTEAYSFTR